jgi:glyoxylase-like metal-dependent hydrolase (beta-lactamase superfamily II)
VWYYLRICSRFENSMPSKIHVIDLNFQNIPGAMAVYVILHRRGAVLIDSGPGSTLDQLQAALQQIDLSPRDITDVLLTHIHLDHAGAAGWWARQGAQIHVHPIGAPHLLNPEKLIASATRIYGDMMDQLWGQSLAVPEDRLHRLHDHDQIDIEDLHFVALDTPGHADHHLAYLFEDVGFSGDIGGVRIAPDQYLCLPMPPPEFHIEKWRASVQKLRQAKIKRIVPTHFGIHADIDWHLTAIEAELDQIEAWLQKVMPADPSIDQLRDQYIEWVTLRAVTQGFDAERSLANEAANPSFMSAAGMHRYWKKYRT